ncbi:MAG: hypothetical protein ACJAYC_000676 [Halieaceae bacterium]|jgi:hypothetical protein
MNIQFNTDVHIDGTEALGWMHDHRDSTSWVGNEFDTDDRSFRIFMRQSVWLCTVAPRQLTPVMHE